MNLTVTVRTDMPHPNKWRTAQCGEIGILTVQADAVKQWITLPCMSPLDSAPAAASKNDLHQLIWISSPGCKTDQHQTSVTFIKQLDLHKRISLWQTTSSLLALFLPVTVLTDRQRGNKLHFPEKTLREVLLLGSKNVGESLFGQMDCLLC